MLPPITVLARNFDETKCIYFLIEDAELLEKYNKIWSRVSNFIRKYFVSKPVDNKKLTKKKFMVKSLLFRQNQHRLSL